MRRVIRVGVALIVHLVTGVCNVVVLQARFYSVDGTAHLYFRREFTPPWQSVVTPLHSDAGLHPEYHEADLVGQHVVDLEGVEVCQDCVGVARRLAQAKIRVVQAPSPRRFPELDGLVAAVGVSLAQPAPAGGILR